MDLSAQTIAVTGQTAAIVRHTLAGKQRRRRQRQDVNLYVMLVFGKEAGQWKLVARQAVEKFHRRNDGSFCFRYAWLIVLPLLQ